MVIESKNNPMYKYLKKLQQKKYRQREKLFLVEGPVVLSEALNYAQPQYLALSEDRQERYSSLRENISEDKIHIFRKDLLEQLSDSENSQGVLGYFPFVHGKPVPLKGQFIYCDRIREPGNLGGIIRSADAFGLDGVLLSPQCVDLYNPKTIRSTMSSIFRIPIYELTVEELLAQKISILAATLEEAQAIDQSKFSEDQVLVVGNEAHGVSQEILAHCHGRVRIPIRPQVDSLNVNVAASILIYEMTKCRFS